MTPLNIVCVRPYYYSIETMSVSRTVSEILRDLETGGRSRLKLLKMAPFDRSYTTYYWSAILYHFQVIYVK